MKTLTIRGLPDEVHEGLKKRANTNRRSLNQEIIAELVEVINAKKANNKVDEALTTLVQFRAGLKRTLSSEEILEAIKEGKR